MEQAGPETELDRAVSILRRFDAVMSGPPAQDSAATMLAVLSDTRALLHEIDRTSPGSGS
jgi:hypothetical protein